jgi:hypothetical protein
MDLCVTKSITQDFAVAKSCFDLSFDHSPILITLTAESLNQGKEPILSNRHTNWDYLRRLVSERLSLNIPLKTEEDIEAAVKFFNGTVQCADLNAMPEHKRTLRLRYNN